MKRKTQEYLTGILLGIIFSILFFGKLVFGAELSPEEKMLIARTVHAEAGNQDFEGRRLVASVILNRVESESFPNTVEGVLSQSGQFATYKLLAKTEPNIHDIMAVQMELGERTDNEVLYFRTQHYGTGTPCYQHGDHYFSK